MHAMKAVRIHQYGHSDVLTYEDAPRPLCQADDVLIRVHVTAVNRIDPVVREGYMTSWFSHTLPLILGCDVSGTIAEIGTTSPTLRLAMRCTRAPTLTAMAPTPSMSRSAPPTSLPNQPRSIICRPPLFRMPRLRPGSRYLMPPTSPAGRPCCSMARAVGLVTSRCSSQNRVARM